MPYTYSPAQATVGLIAVPATNRVWIVGAGAIGQLYGYHLHQHAQVSLFARAGRAIDHTLHFYPYQQQPITWHSQPPVDALTGDDLLLLCCKSYQTDEAIAPFTQKLADNTPILLLQNGMGSEESLTHLPNPILKASVTHGALQTPQGGVKHTGMGATHIGLVAGELPATRQTQLTQLLNQALPPVTWDKAITTSLWRKLIINAAINPLTALNGVSNGALQHPRYQETIQQIIQEAISIAQAEGILLAEEALLTTVNEVVNATASNRSSMLQDVLAGRPTENEYITGYLLRKAAQHQLDAPMNAALYQQLAQHTQ